MLLLYALAALLGAVVAAPPALAASSTAKLEVNENCVEADWPCWATPGSSQPASKITIASDGAVTFVDHGREANIAWSGTAPMCEPSVPVAPASSRAGWEGTCTFSQSGAYKFESSTLWFEYTKYEILVESAAATTTSPSTPSPTSGATTSSPAPTGENSAGSPFSGAPAIDESQHGTTVKGSLQIAKAGVGDRLEIDLIATAASLTKAGHATQVVGRLVSASVSAGERSFSVSLDDKARRALKRRHRLALKVKVTLAPVYGEATSITRSVTLHT